MIQIVIDIPDKLHRQIITNTYCENESDFDFLSNYIRRGTPLPKGHGRLIDEDTLKEKSFFATAFTEVVDVLDIDDSPTIIEADKESEVEE